VPAHVYDMACNDLQTKVKVIQFGIIHSVQTDDDRRTQHCSKSATVLVVS